MTTSKPANPSCLFPPVFYASERCRAIAGSIYGNMHGIQAIETAVPTLSRHPGPLIRHVKAQRRFWFPVHMYLGLTLGAILSVISLTGSVLVFRMEIDELTHPELIRVAPASGATYRSLEEMVSAARSALPPGATLNGLNWPRHPHAAVMFTYAVPNPAAAGKPDEYNLFVDPYTARVTGKRLWYSAESWWENAFLGIVYKIHYALMIRPWGTVLVGTMAVFFVLLTVTGLYVWWPLTGKWRQSLIMTWPTSTPRLNFELHKTIGFYSMLVLTTMLITGIYLDMPEPIDWLLQRISSLDRPGVPATTTPDKPLTLDEAVAAALRSAPDSTPAALDWTNNGKYILLEQRPIYAFGVTGRRMTVIDLATGAIREVGDPVHGTFGTVYTLWQLPLHSGRVIGWPGRILVFLAGLVCPVLFVTGFSRWLWKRRRRAALRRAHPALARGTMA